MREPLAPNPEKTRTASEADPSRVTPVAKRCASTQRLNDKASPCWLNSDALCIHSGGYIRRINTRCLSTLAGGQSPAFDRGRACDTVDPPGVSSAPEINISERLRTAVQRPAREGDIAHCGPSVLNTYFRDELSDLSRCRRGEQRVPSCAPSH